MMIIPLAADISPIGGFCLPVYIPSNEHQEKVCSQEVAFSFLGAARGGGQTKLVAICLL
jgi:hypothetical protein